MVADATPAGADSRPGPDMVWIPGGTFVMGSDDHYPEEAPAHPVTVGGFWIDRHTVTNAEFARFVHKTGYVTVAERPPDPADYPGAKPDLLIPASTVFRQPPQTHSETSHACCTVDSPRGGDRERSYDPQLPHVRIPRKVMKGGSHLCAQNYCRRYRPAARMPQPIDTSTSHLGFRCIVRP
jgi:formylglycine-generating enzyme required for sulfatase activity